MRYLSLVLRHFGLFFFGWSSGWLCVLSLVPAAGKVVYGRRFEAFVTMWLSCGDGCGVNLKQDSLCHHCA